MLQAAGALKVLGAEAFPTFLRDGGLGQEGLGVGGEDMAGDLKQAIRVAEDAAGIAKGGIPGGIAVEIGLRELDEILGDVGLVGVEVAAHIGGVRLALLVDDGQLERLIGQAVGNIQHFFDAVQEGVAGVGDTQQQNLAMDGAQAVVAAAGGAGRVGLQLTGKVGFGVFAVGGEAVGRVKGADDAWPLAEQLGQDADAAGAGPDIKHRAAAVDEPPCVGGQQEQAVGEIFHQGVKHGVGTALHRADGTHGGVDQDGLGSGQTHSGEVGFQVLFCVRHERLLFPKSCGKTKTSPSRSVYQLSSQEEPWQNRKALRIAKKCGVAAAMTERL